MPQMPVFSDSIWSSQAPRGVWEGDSPSEATLLPCVGKVNDGDDATPQAASVCAHKSLVDHMPFTKFAQHTWQAACPQETDGCVELFFGQVPRHLTPLQLLKLVEQLTKGVVVPRGVVPAAGQGYMPHFDKEKRQGGFFVYVLPTEYLHLRQRLNLKVLCDRNGVWHAETEAQCQDLRKYTEFIASDKTITPSGCPYKMLTVEISERSQRIQRQQQRYFLPQVQGLYHGQAVAAPRYYSHQQGQHYGSPYLPSYGLAVQSSFPAPHASSNAYY